MLDSHPVGFHHPIAAIALGLRLLDVRDRSCYAAAFASLPVLEACGLGSISALLFLGVAAAWRYRDRTFVVAIVVAAVVAAKLFLWPLWLWLVYTRRYAAAALSVALAVLGVCVAWAVIGARGLAEYPHLLGRLTELTGVNSFSLYALLRSSGVPVGGAKLGVLAVCVALAALSLGTRRADDASLIAALGIALLLTPILWPHYLVLLLVPVALVRPRMSPLWLVPLLFWFGGVWSSADPSRIVPTLAVATALALVSLQLAQRRAGYLERRKTRVSPRKGEAPDTPPSLTERLRTGSVRSTT